MYRVHRIYEPPPIERKRMTAGHHNSVRKKRGWRSKCFQFCRRVQNLEAEPVCLWTSLFGSRYQNKWGVNMRNPCLRHSITLSVSFMTSSYPASTACILTAGVFYRLTSSVLCEMCVQLRVQTLTIHLIHLDKTQLNRATDERLKNFHWDKSTLFLTDSIKAEDYNPCDGMIYGSFVTRH